MEKVGGLAPIGIKNVDAGNTGSVRSTQPAPEYSYWAAGGQMHPRHQTPWVQLYDPTTKNMYYYNQSSGETTWDPPQAFQPLQFVVCPPTQQTFPGQEQHGHHHHHHQQQQQQQQQAYHNAQSYSQYHQQFRQSNYGQLQQQQQQQHQQVRSYNSSSQQFAQVREDKPIYDSFDEDETTDDEQDNTYGLKEERCWGRPGRPASRDGSSLDSEVGGRFRTISSIDPPSLMHLSKFAEKGRRRGSVSKSSRRSASPLHWENGSPASSPSAGSPPPVQQFGMRNRANTTNSIYVTSTISDPDPIEELKCISGVIHAHMVQFILAPELETHPRYAVFDDDYDKGKIISGPSTHPPPLLRTESAKVRQAMRVPTREVIYDFVYNVFTKAQMEKECVIMSFAYLERLLKATKGHLTLNERNWKGIVLSTMILASKVWDDLSMWNADFSKICPSFTLQRINELEICLLEAMKYEVRVTASQYAKYYFQLRAMRKALGIIPTHSADEDSLSRSGHRLARFASEKAPKKKELRRRCNTLKGEFVLKRNDSLTNFL